MIFAIATTLLLTCCLIKVMPKSQIISKHQFIFDLLLDDLLLQFTIKSNFVGSNIIYVYVCIDYLSIILIIVPDLRLQRSLEKLKQELFNLIIIVNRPTSELWWQTKHPAWVEELNTTISFFRNIQSYYYEDLSGREILKLYYDANTFLIDCLDRHQKLTIALRRKIETALLSYEAELSQRQCKYNKRSNATFK